MLARSGSFTTACLLMIMPCTKHGLARPRNIALHNSDAGDTILKSLLNACLAG
jgi:hypothetical protein